MITMKLYPALYIFHLSVNFCTCYIILVPKFKEHSKIIPDLFGPQLVHYGTTAKLLCNFKLKPSHLISVKWYKDDVLIYEFSPQSGPHVKIDHRQLCIDESQSDMHVASLCNITGDHAGRYSCEVLADNMKSSVVRSANIIVFSYPEQDPELNIDRRTYGSGKQLIANCTSGKTLPPTVLHWFVNGIEVDKKFIVKEEIIFTSGFYRTFSSINYTANYYSENLMLVCVARILDRLPETKATISFTFNQFMNNHGYRVEQDLSNDSNGLLWRYFALMLMNYLLH